MTDSPRSQTTVIGSTNPSSATTRDYGLPAVLTVDEVAVFMRCDRKTIYEAAKAGTIPAQRLGRRIVILRDALLRWLSSSSGGPQCGAGT